MNELTANDQARRTKLVNGEFVEVHRAVFIVVRPATPEELEPRLRLKDQIAKTRALLREAQGFLELLESTCDHLLCWDDHGFDMDVRSCAVCGASKGGVW